jgi:hypothetical protein
MPMRSLVSSGCAAVLAMAAGCYTYAPVDSAAPAPAGQYVSLRITDQGRVGLDNRFGEGVRRITGRVVEQDGNDVVVSVDHVSNLDGETIRWAGDTTRVQRSYIGYIEQRKLSAGRTSLIAATAIGAIYAMTASGLVGGGRESQSIDDPNDGKAKDRAGARPRFSHDIRVPLWRIWIR